MELRAMKRVHVLLSILLLTGVSLAQQPANNAPDRAANAANQTYNHPVEGGHNWGGWGLLGLIGLAGLFRRRGQTTIVSGTDYTRGDRSYEEQRRRAA